MKILIFGYKKITEKEIQQPKEVNPKDDLAFFQELAKSFTFAFMIDIRDNNKDNTPEVIKKWHHTDITAYIVTGDNINTTIAISKDVEIIEPNLTLECKRIAQ